MGYAKIKEKIYPYIPQSLLKHYRNLKRLLGTEEERTRKYNETGNNVALVKAISLDASVLDSLQIDSIKVSRYMSWQNPFREDDYGKYQYSEKVFPRPDTPKLELSFNNFGLWRVEIDYLKNGKVKKHDIQDVKVEAPEYNIVYLAATLPVIFYLSEMWGITNKNRPSIIGLERSLFNYNKLPDNVFPFPMASQKELDTPYSGFNRYAQRLVAYIGYLYRMNPEAKFHLYLCDHEGYFALALLYANKIPEKNFDVHLLSDGTGSYNCYKYIFKGDNSPEIFDKMQRTWELSKKKASEDGVQQWGKESFIKCGSPSVSERAQGKPMVIELANRMAYAYVLANSNSNFEWVLHDPALLGEYTGNIRKISFIDDNSTFKMHKEELAALLNIDYSLFDGKRERKCILLGSLVPEIECEKRIEETLQQHGDKYSYFYKPHPMSKMTDEFKRKLEKLGICVLNSKLPPEFFMMTYPDIYLAGYYSSVFLSVNLLCNPKEQVLAIWEK